MKDLYSMNQDLLLPFSTFNSLQLLTYFNK